MARSKPQAASARPAALILAERLRTAITGDPDFAVDDLPSETGKVIEPGAMFHVETADGRRYRVRVNRA
jgi:hypothetical protein